MGQEEDWLQFFLAPTHNAIMSEAAENAVSFANHRTVMKDLFLQANLLLQQSGKHALGMSEKYIRIAISGKPTSSIRA